MSTVLDAEVPTMIHPPLTLFINQYLRKIATTVHGFQPLTIAASLSNLAAANEVDYENLIARFHKLPRGPEHEIKDGPLRRTIANSIPSFADLHLNFIKAQVAVSSPFLARDIPFPKYFSPFYPYFLFLKYTYFSGLYDGKLLAENLVDFLFLTGEYASLRTQDLILRTILGSTCEDNQLNEMGYAIWSTISLLPTDQLEKLFPEMNFDIIQRSNRNEALSHLKKCPQEYASHFGDLLGWLTDRYFMHNTCDPDDLKEAHKFYASYCFHYYTMRCLDPEIRFWSV